MERPKNGAASLAPSVLLEYHSDYPDPWIRLSRDHPDFDSDYKPRTTAKIVQLPELGPISGILKCCFCYRVPAPENASSCRRGHTICVSCVENKEHRTCQKVIDEAGQLCNESVLETSRRPMLELFSTFYNISLYRCAFKKFGCDKRSTGKGLANHEKRCIHCFKNFRIQHCPDARLVDLGEASSDRLEMPQEDECSAAATSGSLGPHSQHLWEEMKISNRRGRGRGRGRSINQKSEPGN